MRSMQLAPGEEVPTAVGTHLHDVAGELVVRGTEALQLARVHDAAPVGLAEVVAHWWHAQAERLAEHRESLSHRCAH